MNKTAVGIVVLVVAALLIRGVSGSKNKITDLGGGALDIVKDAGNAVVDGAEGAVDGATDLAKDGVNAVADGAEAVVDEAKEGAAAVVDGTKDLADDAVDTMKDGVDTVIEGAEDVVEGAADTVKDAADTVVDGTQDAVEGAIDTVKDGAEAVVDGAKDVVEGAVDTVKDGIEEVADMDSKNTITWTGKAMGKSHTGVIVISKADLEVSDDKVTGGSFEVDMTTIKATDIDSEKLNDHLKADDFFDVANYPISTLKITNVEGNTITADLMIKGKTNPVTFDIETNNGMATASFAINSQEWGIVEGAKDVIVSDDITFEVSIEL